MNRHFSLYFKIIALICLCALLGTLSVAVEERTTVNNGYIFDWELKEHPSRLIFFKMAHLPFCTKTIKSMFYLQ